MTRQTHSRAVHMRMHAHAYVAFAYFLSTYLKRVHRGHSTAVMSNTNMTSTDIEKLEAATFESVFRAWRN